MSHNNMFFYSHAKGLNFQDYVEKKNVSCFRHSFSLSDFKNFLIAAYVYVFFFILMSEGIGIALA